MATHFSILAWEIPWTQKPGGLQFMGSQESDMTLRPNHHGFSYIQPFACAVISANRSISNCFLGKGVTCVFRSHFSHLSSLRNFPWFIFRIYGIILHEFFFHFLVEFS